MRASLKAGELSAASNVSISPIILSLPLRIVASFSQHRDTSATMLQAGILWALSLVVHTSLASADTSEKWSKHIGFSNTSDIIYT